MVWAGATLLIEGTIQAKGTTVLAELNCRLGIVLTFSISTFISPREQYCENIRRGPSRLPLVVSPKDSEDRKSAVYTTEQRQCRLFALGTCISILQNQSTPTRIQVSLLA